MPPGLERGPGYVNYVYQSRCECGKVIYLSQERATFAAVQMAAFHGVPTLAYQCRTHERFWHLGTVTRKSDIRQFKWEVEGRWLRGKRQAQ